MPEVPQEGLEVFILTEGAVMAYQVWHARCKCGTTSTVDDCDGKITRDQANKTLRDRGWLIADKSEQEGGAVCPGCKPK